MPEDTQILGSAARWKNHFLADGSGALYPASASIATRPNKKWPEYSAGYEYSAQGNERTKDVEDLAKQIASQAFEKAYEQAVRAVIDAVIRFGACACDVNHDDGCVWSKNMKEAKAWARQALEAAKLAQRLK